jgi:hypothetical protein
VKNSYKLWTTFACLGLTLVVYNGCSPEEPAPEANSLPNVPAPAAPKQASQTISPIPETTKGEPTKGAAKDEMKTPEKKDEAPKDVAKEETKTPEKKDETPK